MTKKIFLRTLTIVSVIGIMCLLAGCSTTIPVTYTEPARLNMSGIKRIAVKSNDAQVTNNISHQLSATGTYTIASASELSEWEQWLPLGQLQATAVEVSSTDLVAAYKANAARADISYGNKLIRTSGNVAEIGRSSRGRYYARLNVGNDSVAIYFADSEFNKLASIDKGQTITVIGMNHGFNLPDMEDTAEILRVLGAGQRVNITDATFPIGDYSGRIDAVIDITKITKSIEDSSNRVRRVLAGKDANGNNVYRDENYTIYERSVSITLNYKIVRARNGSTIAHGIKTATSSKSSSENPSNLATVSQLEAKTIGKPLQELANEIVPVQHTISLTLAKPDDNNAKNDMKAAEKMAKSKNYADAAAAYGAIYSQYGNFAAGYNQALLTEASENTAKGIELMTALVQKFSDNPTAQNTLADMRRREAANQQSLQQLSR